MILGEAHLGLKLITGDAVQSQLRRRRSPWLFKTVPTAAVDLELAAGWQIAKVNRASVRLKRAKPIDEALEDEVWSLLARLGFTEMSAGRRFQIPVGGQGGPTKQIDVMACDDETALVVECKASVNVAPRPLGKDLAEAHGLRGSVARSLRQHYGLKKRIGLLFVTRNIVWGRADKSRAYEFGIRVLNENDLDYFSRLADIIGSAARHQLQAEIFGDQTIEGLNRKVPAVRGRIGGKRFYQFTIEPERLLKIAFVSHRARLDAESIGAYQRMLRRGRLRSIREYIDGGGVFPTNVVVNFRTRRRFDAGSDKPEGDIALGTLYLPNSYKSAWIIDGQHRLYGFAGSKWAKSTQLPVLAFEELPPAQEAAMFVDINNKQVKVPRNLLVELMSELYWDSTDPEEAYHALLSRTVSVLGRELGSPFRNRIVQEGDSQTPDTPLTVTAIYEGIKKSGLVGTVRKGVFNPGPLYEVDSMGALRRTVDVLTAYFGRFADRLPDHWARGNGEGGYLCTNNGLSALLLVLEQVVEHLDRHAEFRAWQATPEELAEAIRSYQEPIIQWFAKATPADIRHYRRQVGNVGQRQAAFGMMELINAEKTGFDPPGLQSYLKSQDQTGTNAARLLMPELQLRIHDTTLRLLVGKFGDDESGWWRKGVPERVRTEVAARREASPEGGAYDQFFELLDYRAIATAHWEQFQPYFAIGDGRSKEKQLGWFSSLNGIRNRVAHPERGPVSEDELAFIESVMEHFEGLADTLPADRGS